jgi:hypothetical protein
MIPAGTGMAEYKKLQVAEPEFEEVELPVHDGEAVEEQEADETAEAAVE